MCSLVHSPRLYCYAKLNHQAASVSDAATQSDELRLLLHQHRVKLHRRVIGIIIIIIIIINSNIISNANAVITPTTPTICSGGAPPRRRRRCRLSARLPHRISGLRLLPSAFAQLKAHLR